MSIILTGDTHGIMDIGKLMPRAFDYDGLTKDDYIIILGDFGVVFTNRDRMGNVPRRERYWLDWLESRPWTTLFIDGNHENHPRLASEFPVKNWNGGKVHELRENVLHLMRGEIFTLESKTFLAMGGAMSTDKQYRTEGVSWWSEEIPNDAEMQNCLDNLAARDWKVDYVLTHDCPVNVSQEIATRYGMGFMPDRYENWLQFVADKTEFDHWFFGHYHVDIPSLGVGGKYTCLFEQFYDVTEDNWSLRKKDVDEISPYDVPAPEHELGYTYKEIMDIAGCSEEDFNKAMYFEMRGSTMGYDAELGEPLVYRGDMMGRVLPLITNIKTRIWNF